MTSARETLAEIACAVRGSIECPCVVHDDPCKDCFDNAQRIVAALDAAGFAVAPKALLKPKVNAKAFARLDEMAEADIAMDGDHALSILLKHYRELTAAKEPKP